MNFMNTGSTSSSRSWSSSSSSSSSRINRNSSWKRRGKQQHHQQLNNGVTKHPATSTKRYLYGFTKLLYIIAAWSVFMFLIIRSRFHAVSGVVGWEKEAYGGGAANKALEEFALQSANERVPAAIVVPFANIKFPILNVGLPGSGMESIYHYFNCSGLRTQHGCCCGDLTFSSCQINSLHMCMLSNLQKQKQQRTVAANETRQQQSSMLHGCDGKKNMAGSYHVFTELSGTYQQDDNNNNNNWNNNTRSIFLPQHYHLNDLHVYAPHATWILPIIHDAIIWTSQTHYQKKWRRRFLNEYEWNHVYLSKDSNSTSGVIIPNRTEVSEIRFLHEFYNNHTRKVIEFCRLHPTHRLVIVNLSATTTHGTATEADDNEEESAGRVMEKTFGVSADRCWQDPVDDLTVNHIHDIVKHAVETKDAPIQTPKLRLPLPVIVVGFPKSGTTSVWSFFRCAGIVAQHYCCCGDVSARPPCYTHTFAECMLDNIGHNRSYSSMMQGCGDYPVYAQLDGERSYFDKILRKQPQLFLSHYLPQHFHLDEIHNFAPTATYVLPLRDPMAWAESVNHWFNMQVRVSNEYRFYNDSLVTRLLPRSQKRDIARLPESQALELLAKLYQDHTEMVRNFVRQHPSHALVEFNITQHDAGQILSNAFGLPSSCWVRTRMLFIVGRFAPPRVLVGILLILFSTSHHYYNITGTQEQKRQDETKHYNGDCANVTRVLYHSVVHPYDSRAGVWYTKCAMNVLVAMGQMHKWGRLGSELDYTRCGVLVFQVMMLCTKMQAPLWPLWNRLFNDISHTKGNGGRSCSSGSSSTARFTIGSVITTVPSLRKRHAYSFGTMLLGFFVKTRPIRAFSLATNGQYLFWKE